MHALLFAAAILPATLVNAQFVPLADKRFKYPDGIPQQVDTDGGVRGHQKGYNICNGSTEGPDSLCQTGFLNSLDDFCFWAPPAAGQPVGNIEGEMVAWCTKPGHGTRVIPPGAISGVQLTRTPDYIQVVGFMDQTKVNMMAGDFGGEMDPHGADRRGNPLGGIMFTNAFGGDWAQVVEWHNFMGANMFCLKACDQSRPNAAKFCEHRFDRIGCAYNAPSEAKDGVFESCAGDSQDYPGIYTDAAGAVQTYTQPPESLGSISTMPYVARVPKSSQCSQFQSAEIYGGGKTVPVPGATPAPTSAGSSSSTVRSTVSSVTASSTGPASVTKTSTPTSAPPSVTTPPPANTAANASASNSPSPSPSVGAAVGNLKQTGVVGAFSFVAAVVQFMF